MLSRFGERMRRKSSLFAGFYNYTIFVKTGDQPRAGTDANVYVIMHGEKGVSSAELRLSATFRDNFERGRMDKFKIKYQPLSVLDHIEIWRDNFGMSPDWFLETIMIVNLETKVKTVFPIFRWIRPNYRYRFYPLDTSLPQNNLDCADQRRIDLEEKRELYQYNVTSPGLPARCKTIPSDEVLPGDSTLESAKLRAKMAMKGKLVRLTTGQWRSLEDIKKIYTKKTFPPPASMDRWCFDEAFALQRLAGVNNTFIRRCREIPRKLGVTDDMVAQFLEGDSLALALSDRKIFIVDYDILENIPTLSGYKVCAPIALFYERSDGILVPIAIQLHQNKGDDNPVFMPTDPHFTWTLAKMWFNNADACVHQAVAHVGSTHMAMEGIAVSVHRNLSQSHPIYRLLAPHLRCLIGINRHGQEKSFAPNTGWVESTMSIGREGFTELVRRYYSTWRMDINCSLPGDLRSRDVDDCEILKEYHFRNDAMLIYDALRKYVTSYVLLYYNYDRILMEDIEVQSWRMEMTSPLEEGGLGLQGVAGDSDRFTSRQQLIEVCSCIMYTCSIAHQATVGKQYDEYAFPPNFPARLNGEPPKDKRPRTEADLLAVLPDKVSTLEIMKVTKLFSVKRSRPLGDFDLNFVYDPEAVKAVKEFREDLKRASQTIKARNKTRTVPYPFLDPIEIPNNLSV